MAYIQKYVRNNRGQALVEFALVMPVLLLLALGIMEFGVVIHENMVVAEASREGARSAALGGSDTVVETAAKNAATGLDGTKVLVTISPSLERTTGDPVTVQVEYPVQAFTPLFGAFFPSGSRVKGVTVMRVE